LNTGFLKLPPNQTLHQTPDSSAVLAGAGAGAGELNIKRQKSMQTYIRKITEKYDKYVRALVFEIKPQLVLILLLFSMGLLLGLRDISSLNNFLNEILNAIAQPLKERSGFYLFISILLQNLKASVVTIYSGIFFALMPMLSAVMNGIIIGALPTNPNVSRSLSSLELFICLIPHGIFEIPALLISLAMGIKLGSWPFKKNKKQFIKGSIKKFTLCFMQLIIPLLIIAALIEAIGIEAWRN